MSKAGYPAEPVRLEGSFQMDGREARSGDHVLRGRRGIFCGGFLHTVHIYNIIVM